MYDLFITDEFFTIKQKRLLQIKNDINTLKDDYILNTTNEKIFEYIINKYSFTFIVIDEKKISRTPSYEMIDIRDDPREAYMYRVYGNPLKRINLSLFHIPYTGDKILFYCKTSSSLPVIPHGKVTDNEIILCIEIDNKDVDKIKSELKEMMDRLKYYIGAINYDVSVFNNEIKNYVFSTLDVRRNKIQASNKILDELGYPLKVEDIVPKTQILPIKIKSYKQELPSNINTHSELKNDDEIYNDIIHRIYRMSIAAERTPETYNKLSEEEIRNILITKLNDDYEGQVSGETFNCFGKTDILIKEKDKNLFIGECKFWKGAEVLLSTIDQLLKYVGWRDSKTAIIIFNKNKDFTNVLNQIKDTVCKHPNYKSDEGIEKKTIFKYMFTDKDDKEKQIFLTILAFNLVQNNEKKI